MMYKVKDSWSFRQRAVTSKLASILFLLSLLFMIRNCQYFFFKELCSVVLMSRLICSHFNEVSMDRCIFSLNVMLCVLLHLSECL